MKRIQRALGLAAAAALVGTGVVLAVPSSASAATIGSATITIPGAIPNAAGVLPGTDISQFNGNVTAACPAGTDEAQWIMVGPGTSAPISDPNTTTGVGTFNFTGASFGNLKGANPGFATAGNYVAQFACLDYEAVATPTSQIFAGYVVTASYDSQPFVYAPSTGTFTYTPPARATATVLTASPTTPVEQGAAVTLSADVTPTTGADNPTGTVAFFLGATALGTGSALSATGVSTLVVSSLPIGVNANITAVFTPAGATFTASTSNAVSVTVTAVAPRTTVATLTVNPVGTVATPGTAYTSTTLTCTVVASTGTATGSVAFKNNGTTIATVTASTAGVWTATVSGFGPGSTNVLTCDYAGNAPYTGSVSAPVTSVIAGSTAVIDEQTVVVTIPAGVITITTPYTPTSPLDLGSAILNPATSTYGTNATAVNFNKVTITDSRSGNLGFTAQVVAGAFTNGANTFPGSYAGFINLAAQQVPANGLTATNVVLTNNAAVTPGLGTPKTFAAYPAGLAIGSVDIVGTFYISGVPTSVVPGLYTSTVVFSVS